MNVDDCKHTDASAATDVSCNCGTLEIGPKEVCNHDYSPNQKLRRCTGNGAVEIGKCACCTVDGKECAVTGRTTLTPSQGDTCEIDTTLKASKAIKTVGPKNTYGVCGCDSTDMFNNNDLCSSTNYYDGTRRAKHACKCQGKKRGNDYGFLSIAVDEVCYVKNYNAGDEQPPKKLSICHGKYY